MEKEITVIILMLSLMFTQHCNTSNRYVVATIPYSIGIGFAILCMITLLFTLADSEENLSMIIREWQSRQFNDMSCFF